MRSAKPTAVVVCLWLLVAAALVAPPPARAAETPINEQLTESSGWTPILGGGDHVFVRFGRDAAFGVMWGLANNTNYVTLIAIKARYLGQVHVVENGTEVREFPLRVYTVYAVRLEDIFEFSDVDGDGVVNYTRTDNGVDYTTYQDREPIYRRAPLKTSWTPTAVIRGNDTVTGERTWDFNVSAMNLRYFRVNATSTPPGGARLDRVTFSFHLAARLVRVDNATIAQYRVEVGQNGTAVTGVSRLEDLRSNGTVARYRVRWGQMFEGWDFDPQDTVNPRLSLEMHAIVGNFLPADLARWVARFLSRASEDGRATFQDASGTVQATNTTGSYSVPRRLTTPAIDFDGNWTRIGRLTWVSTATVDGNPTPIYAQVQGARRLAFVGESGWVYVGFILLAGITYPGGNVIQHDPEVSAEAFLVATVSGPAPAGFPLGLALVLLIVAIVAVVVILFMVRSGRKGKVPPPPEPPPEGP